MADKLEHVLREWVSKEYFTAWMEAHPEAFEDAIQLATSEETLIGWRAAWLVVHRMQPNDIRLRNNLSKIVRVIPERESGHQRELLKILLKMDIPEELEGFLFDACMGIWEQVGKSSSVRSIAMQYIVRVLKKYPELISEVQFITEERYLEPLSPGIRGGVERLIAGIHK